MKGEWGGQLVSRLTSEAITNLAFRQGLKHAEVEESNQGRVAKSEMRDSITITEIKCEETNYAPSRFFRVP